MMPTALVGHAMMFPNIPNGVGSSAVGVGQEKEYFKGGNAH